MPSSSLPSSTPALACRAISKNFGNHVALERANLDVHAGTIHGLVGENGAGKSTLMNIVSGLLQADAGSVEIFGEPSVFRSSLDAAAAGIGMVHQHFLLADALTVAENIALGRRTSPAGWRFDRQRVEAEVEQLSLETGLKVDPHARAGDLPVGLRQRVEILKALSRGARILLLDEPTAVLAPPEIEPLFSTLRGLQQAGKTIVLITHKLDEIFKLASDVTVLRRGQTTFTGSLKGLTPAVLAEKMIGPAKPKEKKSPAQKGKAVLEAHQLSCPAEAKTQHGPPLHEASFNLQAGEILGVAGVEGNGQEGLAGTLAGTRQAGAGSKVTFQNADLLSMTIRGRAEAGLAFIPGDRHREGLVLELTLAENLYLREAFAKGRSTEIMRGPLLSTSKMMTKAEPRLKAFGVDPPRANLTASHLSGGNQQKIVIARELARSPRVIIACNPARGLDVAAAAAVHERLMRAAREDGAGVLLISSDLDEILELSDRIAVLFKGRLKMLGERGVDRDRVGQEMVGAALEVGNA